MSRTADALAGVLFPLWQMGREEYTAVCRYLGLPPSERLYERLSAHLAQAPFREACPVGFALHLARPRLTPFRIARLDLATRLLFPGHPVRHALNAVIAVHECDGRGFREMASTPTGIAVWPRLMGAASRLALNALATSAWLIGQLAAYAVAAPFRNDSDLHGKRVLITGAGGGLGRDLLLHCLERGAAVVGTVRSADACGELTSSLPPTAPLKLIVADLARPGALTTAMQAAKVEPQSIDIAIACAGVKHAGTTCLSLAELRQTFEVNLFAAAELANWLYARADLPAPAAGSPKSFVVISSLGRWHGMSGSGGYNASKAALSIWAESVEMDLQQASPERVRVTLVEPGLFASAMTRRAGLSRLLSVSRRNVAEAIVGGAVAGRRSIRPPFWFALLTWGLCLSGRAFRARVLGRVKPGAE